MKFLFVLLALSMNAMSTQAATELLYKLNTSNPGLVIFEDIHIKLDGKVVGVTGLIPVNAGEDPCALLYPGEYTGAAFAEHRDASTAIAGDPVYVYLNTDGTINHLKSDYHVPAYSLACRVKGQKLEGYMTSTEVPTGTRFDGLFVNYRGIKMPLNAFNPADAGFFCSQFHGASSKLIDAHFSSTRHPDLSPTGDVTMGKYSNFFMFAHMKSENNIVLKSIICKKE